MKAITTTGNFGLSLETTTNAVGDSVYFAVNNAHGLATTLALSHIDDNSSNKPVRIGSNGSVWDFTTAGVFKPAQFKPAAQAQPTSKVASILTLQA